MSQRLLITSSIEKNEWPDCVINPNTEDVEEELIKEWLGCNGSWFLGPWKISIEDFGLFLKVQPLIEKVLIDRNKEYPNDVWAFYYGKERIEHPTKQELKKWILMLGFSNDEGENK